MRHTAIAAAFAGALVAALPAMNSRAQLVPPCECWTYQGAPGPLVDAVPSSQSCAHSVTMPPAGGVTAPFSSMCWSSFQPLTSGAESGPGAPPCLYMFNGFARNVDGLIGAAAGQYPPRNLDPAASSSPLLAAGVNHLRGPSTRLERPTLAQNVDLVSGMPLIQEIDFELPFGSAVYRHIRTYSEVPATGGQLGEASAYVPGGPLNYTYVPEQLFYDWVGQGWMNGESPLFLIDAAYWRSENPASQKPQCVLMPDAHHSIPFIQDVDGTVVTYTAPPRFDATLGFEGEAEWDATEHRWGTPPAEWYVWLHHQSVKYTFKPVYEDVPPDGMESVGGFHIPPATALQGELEDPIWYYGWPYYGLLTSIDDQYGNRIEIQYCDWVMTS